MDMLKKYGGWIGIIFVALIASSIGKIAGKSATQSYYNSKSEGQIEKAQEFAAAEFRKQLPVKVDEYTTLQNVFSAGATLIYHYILSANSSDIEKQSFTSEMTGKLNGNVCGNNEMSKVIKAGGSYVYQYVSQDGVSVAEIKFDKQSCGFQ
jgi:hypothetical protein